MVPRIHFLVRDHRQNAVAPLVACGFLACVAIEGRLLACSREATCGAWPNGCRERVHECRLDAMPTKQRERRLAYWTASDRRRRSTLAKCSASLEVDPGAAARLRVLVRVIGKQSTTTHRPTPRKGKGQPAYHLQHKVPISGCAAAQSLYAW